MKLARLTGRSRIVCLMLGVGLWAAWSTGVGGCVFPPNIAPAGNQAPQLTIKAPTLPVQVRQGQEVIVSYNVTDPDGDTITLSIYFDTDKVPTPTTDPLIDTGLGVGSTFYAINTALIPIGTWNIYLVASDGRGGQDIEYAQGTMEVLRARVVTFERPDQTDLARRYGSAATDPNRSQVPIRLTTNGGIYYELFYQRSESGQLVGEQYPIEGGRGTLGGYDPNDPNKSRDLNWALRSVAPGDYYIIANYRDELGDPDTIDVGPVIVDSPPSVSVTGPAEDLELYIGEEFTVSYEITDADSTPEVAIFVDVDRVDNGNEPNNLVQTGITAPTGPAEYEYDTTNFPPGIFFVAVSANDAVNTRVTSYAPGRVEVFDPNVTILFLQPDPTSKLVVSPDGTFNISWQTNAPTPTEDDTLDVVYVEIDPNDDSEVGQEQSILSGAPLRPDATTFDARVLDVEEGKYYQLRIRARTRVNPSNEILVTGATVQVKSNPDVSLLKPSQSVGVAVNDKLFIEWQADHLNPDPDLVSGRMLLDRDDNPDNENEIELTPVTEEVTETPGTYRFSHQLDLLQTSVPVGEYYLLLIVRDGEADPFAVYGRAPVVTAQGVGQLITVTVTPRVTGTFWMGDAGKDLDADGQTDSIVFVGFDFYDSAGSLVSPLGDFDKDSVDDFLIVAQFAKPFRAGEVGDAYVIYGARDRFASVLASYNISSDPNIAKLNLNSVGTTMRGALLVAPQDRNPLAASEGIRSALLLPDLSGDGIGELAFGIPYVDNAQDPNRIPGNLTDPNWFAVGDSLVRPGQLRRGGVIMVTSQNDLNQGLQTPMERVIDLEQIGQWYSGELRWNVEETLTIINDPAPDEHYFTLTAPAEGWRHPAGLNVADNDMAGPRNVPSLGSSVGIDYDWPDDYLLWREPGDNLLLVDGNGNNQFSRAEFTDDRCLFTGYLNGEQISNYGSRILGDDINAHLGVSMAWWRGSFVIGSERYDPVGRTDAGTVYVIPMQSRLSPTTVDPPWNSAVKPSNLVLSDAGPFMHPTLIDQYMGRVSKIHGAQGGARLGAVASLGDLTTGRSGDFNGDGLDDLALGAPGMNSGAGAGYVFYVRLPEPYVFDLAQLNEPNSSPSRRAGLQINGNAGDELGSVVPDGLDFNADGFADAVFGNPKADIGNRDDAGQVILFYGGPQETAEHAGYSIQEIRENGLGAVFNGINEGDSTGAAVRGIGDFDGDGIDDLVIAAPNATPLYDSDGDGILDSEGVDRDRDGVADDLDGDGVADILPGAGVVYLIYGQRDQQAGTVKPFTSDPNGVDLRKIGTPDLPGAMFVGKGPGDALGGGMTTDGTNDGSFAIGFSSAGDVDGDGLNDILISSVRASPLGHQQAGEVYLIFGTDPGRQ